MELIVKVSIVIAYISIVLEISLLHVPSIASFRSIWTATDDVTKYYSERYARLFRLAGWLKCLIFLPPLIVVYLVFLFPIAIILLDVRPPLGFAYKPGVMLNLVSIALILTGRGITVASVLTMRREAPAQDSSGLMTGGPFRYSRNPGLLGMYVFFLGILVALPSPIFFVGVLVYFVYMDFKVRMEEDFLLNQHGAVFEAYRARTGRYIA